MFIRVHTGRKSAPTPLLLAVSRIVRVSPRDPKPMPEWVFGSDRFTFEGREIRADSAVRRIHERTADGWVALDYDEGMKLWRRWVDSRRPALLAEWEDTEGAYRSTILLSVPDLQDHAPKVHVHEDIDTIERLLSGGAR